jgi:NADH:ubiquinone oxidoreductase subunit F (NADH-binding)/NADH:ubiquinone oxidoreductase subunit E/Pyruvate/2-oxoacid:ferredoxin oxidoreductase delta subunit
VCALTEITPAQIEGVASFYTQFRHRPVGEHLIRVCHGTACHVKGAEQVTEAIRRHLQIGPDEDTDADGRFTIEPVSCLGCCTLAPVMQIDGVTYGHLTRDSAAAAIDDFLELKRRGYLRPAARPTEGRADGLGEIRIGIGSCCIAGGSLDVRAELERAVGELKVPVVVKPVGCVGMCHRTPLVEVAAPEQESVLYAQVRPEDARAIVERHFRPRGTRKLCAALAGMLDRLLDDRSWTPVTRYALDVRDGPVGDFLGRQVHIVTEHGGALDPFDLEDYLAVDGFVALERALTELTPEEVIGQIKASGLRGRGGAGFPSGRKWELVRRAPGDIKYIIGNGDEGDPGAFMDRMLLESYPFRVIEGMIIAAYAAGIHEGLLYIRAEYPLAVQRARNAIRRCEERGLLGDDILGSGFRLRLEIREGAGAFVCGEETALIASLQGERGHPRLRPPYPAEVGLWGRPTLISNVETFATVPWIIRHGWERFAALGTQHSKGTKTFALAGKVARGGLIEVPMGTTIRAIVEGIGGGVAAGRSFKAVQIGGPSGGCIPAELADTPVDYEALTEVGAIMGSGGLVVLDDTDCMVDVARYFLEFTQRESCGKCTPCRVGTRRMLEILERIATGEGQKGDLECLEELALMVKRTSLCGLGNTAPNPVLSTLRYFRDEYAAHLEGRCPAGRCRALIHYVITDACIGCTLCAQGCPADAIPMRALQRHEINDEKCIRCGGCRSVCPVGAVEVH